MTQKQKVATVLAPGSTPRTPGATKWKVELPSVAESDSIFGGCRSIELCYDKGPQIGEGTYGEVFLATPKGDKNDKVALKKIRMDNEKEGFPITAIREIKLLKSLNHPNVIRLREIVRSQVHRVNGMKGSIYMVFDYMDHDLTGLMEREGHRFTIPQIKLYMKQLCEGLNHCHSQGVVHRDLKASNLLIDNKGILKLADFGLARHTLTHLEHPKFTNRVITLWYRPPELLLGAEEYNTEIDMWSVGCIFAELLVGKPIFPGSGELDQLERIQQIMGCPTEQSMPGMSRLTWSQHLNPGKYRKNLLRETLTRMARNNKRELPAGALDFLQELLVFNPKQRLTAANAATHQFYYMDPPACNPKDLPQFQPSHEMELKRLRHEKDEAKKRGQGQQPQQQPSAKRQRADHPNMQHAPHAGRGMANGRAPLIAPGFTAPAPRQPLPAAAAAAYAQGMPPGRHSGLPAGGQNPRGQYQQPRGNAPQNGPYGQQAPYAVPGPAQLPPAGAMGYGPQGYAGYGGGERGSRGPAGAYPQQQHYAAGGGGGYGAYGNAGAHQGGPRGPNPRPSNNASYPPRAEPAWQGQRR